VQLVQTTTALLAGNRTELGEVLGRSSIQENESLENALRRFKRKVQQEDIIKEIRSTAAT